MEGKEVTFEELLLGVSFTQDALVELLIEKGIITQEELLERIKLLQIEELKRKGMSGN